ncbi:orotidine-5'-phosphate decarboxylase [Erysipelothrix enhydrae]|uniref:orotidine-5'-phosphate decarboxylase n=1 Tax=Erysipelothrix enhydrae TaxID=2890314 RepID=UPI002B248FDD|nr:orotidine-5'-phosphate decarboxylase [Erysipelothrix sp. 4322-04]WRB87652.1 orotidine-5'-phosphate decarboxylase [Erysipelothrix sp. 4322-04]
MENVIIALDFEGTEAALSFLDLFEGQKLFVKVGMELYYQSGPSIIHEIKKRGHKIFLDLKLHDIPNTVERTMRRLKTMGVDMTNVHAAGGLEMMEAARNGFGEAGILIAVTQLTSTSEFQMQQEQLVHASLNDSVLHYAVLTRNAGLDGVVCSPLESKHIRETLGSDFLTVTPGIRPNTSEKGDQKRVTTPAQAKANGSSYIVVGRPITQAKDPVLAYEQIVSEWKVAS